MCTLQFQVILVLFVYMTESYILGIAAIQNEQNVRSKESFELIPEDLTSQRYPLKENEDPKVKVVKREFQEETDDITQNYPIGNKSIDAEEIDIQQNQVRENEDHTVVAEDVIRQIEDNETNEEVTQEEDEEFKYQEDKQPESLAISKDGTTEIQEDGTIQSQNAEEYSQDERKEADDDSNDTDTVSRCKVPNDPIFGLARCTEDKYNMECLGTCDQGYVFPNNVVQMKLYCDLKTGIWQPQDAFDDCKLYCTPPCENNGQCDQFNHCICPNEFRGNRCQYAIPLCDFGDFNAEMVVYSCRHDPEGTECQISCPVGMMLSPSNARLYKCTNDGIWNPPTPPKCEVLCDPPCENGGECIRNNQCICTENFRGTRCQYSISLCDIGTLQNGTVSYDCNHYRGITQCHVSCPSGMSLTPSDVNLYTCAIDGMWSPVITPKCEVVCQPPCENGGECSQIHYNHCVCPIGFRGNRCQYPESLCDVNSLQVPMISFNCHHSSEFTECHVMCPLGTILDPAGVYDYKCNVHGQWEPPEPPKCETQCNPPCENGGTCSEMNYCMCAEGFRGDRCQYNNSVCHFDNIHDSVVSYDCSHNPEYTECEVSCPAGMTLTPPGVSLYMCHDNEVWEPPVQPKCEVVCDPPCENGGACIQFNQCVCANGFRGKRCEYNVSLCEFEELNAELVSYDCTHSSESTKCQVTCPSGMTLAPPDVFSYTCSIDGVWYPSDPPKCEVICYPPCENGGTCALHNECTCDAGYRGNRCQIRTDLCNFKEIQPINVSYNCDHGEQKTVCNISCAPGMTLKPHVSFYECDVNGVWTPATQAMCEAVCDPPCENGGYCNPFNECSCVEGFRGHRCQYSTSLCDFNYHKNATLVSYDCSHNPEISECKVSCPSGMVIDPPNADLHKCDVHGKWSPDIVPQCKVLCDPPCQNGGICSQINLDKCICPEGFRGDHCEYAVELCDTSKLNVSMVSFNCYHKPALTACEVACPPGMVLDPTSSSVYTCDIEGKWNIDIKPKCDVVCNPPCENGARCGQLNQCICSSGFRGDRCQYEATLCDFEVLNTRMVSYDCNHSPEVTVCTVACPTGMVLVDHRDIYTCYVNGTWNPADKPKCEYICTPPCENKGRCSQMNRCVCAKGYRGNRCQYSYAACDFEKLNVPLMLHDCSHNSEFTECHVSCPPGLFLNPPNAYLYRCTGTGVWDPPTPPRCDKKTVPLRGYG